MFNLPNHYYLIHLFYLQIHGSTALHIASSKGYIEIVLYLVEKGAEINITDRVS
jgi:ankyrin repeat protein